MFELLLAWIGLGLYVACVFGAMVAGARVDEKAGQRTARTRLRA